MAKATDIKAERQASTVTCSHGTIYWYYLFGLFPVFSVYFLFVSVLHV